MAKKNGTRNSINKLYLYFIIYATAQVRGACSATVRARAIARARALTPPPPSFPAARAAQGIMDAYEEAIEQVRERSRRSSAARAAPRLLRAVAVGR